MARHTVGFIRRVTARFLINMPLPRVSIINLQSGPHVSAVENYIMHTLNETVKDGTK